MHFIPTYCKPLIFIISQDFKKAREFPTIFPFFVGEIHQDSFRHVMICGFGVSHVLVNGFLFDSHIQTQGLGELLIREPAIRRFSTERAHECRNWFLRPLACLKSCATPSSKTLS
jgi:hypothetical protein